jgi:hypothetical protein
MSSLELQLKLAEDRYEAAMAALRAATADSDYLVAAHQLSGAHNQVCRLTMAIRKRDVRSAEALERRKLERACYAWV